MNMNNHFVEFNKKGNKIMIKKSHQGRFTDYCGGKVTEKCIQKGKRSPDPKIRKQAIFAQNARSWKHENGGRLRLVSKHFLGGLVNNIGGFLNQNVGGTGGPTVGDLINSSMSAVAGALDAAKNQKAANKAAEEARKAGIVDEIERKRKALNGESETKQAGTGESTSTQAGQTNSQAPQAGTGTDQNQTAVNNTVDGNGGNLFGDIVSGIMNYTQQKYNRKRFEAEQLQQAQAQQKQIINDTNAMEDTINKNFKNIISVPSNRKGCKLLKKKGVKR